MEKKEKRKIKRGDLLWGREKEKEAGKDGLFVGGERKEGQLSEGERNKEEGKIVRGRRRLRRGGWKRKGDIV